VPDEAPTPTTPAGTPVAGPADSPVVTPVASPVVGTAPTGRPDGRPLLGEAQIEVLRRYGTEHAVDAGDVLFAAGDERYDLIVVLDGEVEIVQGHGRPDREVIVTYGALEFLGEMGLLTGQRVYLSAVASAPGRVLRIPTDRVQSIMAQELDLSELILRSFLFRHDRLTKRGTGLTLVGSRFDANTRRLLETLARNRLPSRWVELEGSAEAETLLRELHVPVDDLPIVVVPGGPLLRNPSNRDLLAALGLVPIHEDANRAEICDLLVVGGGPAGLAAAVYGASEGMTTTLAEDTALGGQAGTSSRIENYLGFPAGLSGEELAARAALQAQKFGVRIKLAARAVGLSTWNGTHHVRFEDGEVVSARSVIIATGARYNRLPLDRLADFEGVGVYYAATQMEAQACAGRPAVVVGGGNSAGQAALFLARTCTRVHVAIRGDDLGHSMSRYLIDQIDHHPVIDVLPHTEVVRLVGEQALDGVELRNNADGSTSVVDVCGLFVFIGAKPSTDWLDGQLVVDDHGFVLTGNDLPDDVAGGRGQPPLLMETCRPGIFCVGDVRSGSVKRAATAIGEGSMAVRLVFDRLQATGLAVAAPPS
jgi:thioredoxin reductase (NADPH)